MKERQDWVDSLAVGDKVAMDLGSNGYSRFAIATITKITPTRRILTSNGRTFKSNGGEYGKRDSWSPSTHLQPLTQHIIDTIARNNMTRVINSVKWESLTLDEISKVYAIVKEKSE